MRDILAEIVEQKKDIVAQAKRDLPLAELKRSLKPGTFRMSERFAQEPWSLIAECKLQSPAKGRLTKSHSVVELAHIYEANGASMLSVHTDPHFLGCNEDFQRVRAEVTYARISSSTNTRFTRRACSAPMPSCSSRVS